MVKKFLLSSFIFILSLASFELFLRYSSYYYGTSPVVYDKDIGMWHKKNYHGVTVKECYKNDYFFDEEGLSRSIVKYDINKSDVIILGDSYIEAIMIKNENIIHNSLAKELNYKYNLLNYGLSGTSPTQQFIILKKKVNLDNVSTIIQVIQLDGDLEDVDSKHLNSLARPKVFVAFDTLDKYTIIYPRTKTLYDSIGDILGEYQIYFFIKKSLYCIKNLKTSLFTHKKFNDNQENIKQDFTKNWLYLKGAIFQIKKLLKNKNINYKIIITGYSSKNKKTIEKFLNKENIRYIFLDDLYKNNGLKISRFSCDSHWDDNMHKTLAKC